MYKELTPLFFLLYNDCYKVYVKQSNFITFRRSGVPSPTDTLTSLGSVRTAKAERRMKERLIQEVNIADSFWEYTQL